MAFEDFKELTPVIILGDNDTTTADTYNRIEIKDGSEATPEVFNEGIMDSLNRDINLESALTYLARSATLYTTPNTKFLSHCEGKGIDIITNTPPTFESDAVSPSTVFIDDATFIGAAYPQGYIENMLSAFHTSAGAVTTDYPRTTNQYHPYIPYEYGWARTFSGSFEPRVKITDYASSTAYGPHTEITTNLPGTSQYVPGEVVYKSAKFRPRYHRDSKTVHLYCFDTSAASTSINAIYTHSTNNGVLVLLDGTTTQKAYFDTLPELYTRENTRYFGTKYMAKRIKDIYTEGSTSPYKPEFDEKYVIVYQESATSDKIFCEKTTTGDIDFWEDYIADVISAGIHVQTDDDLFTSGAAVIITLNFYDVDNVQIPDEDNIWSRVLTNVSGYNSFLKIEGIKIPARTDTVEIQITCSFKTYANTFRISQIMAQASEVLSGYVSTTRASSSCQYNASILNNYLVNLNTSDTATGSDYGTVAFWTKFRKTPIVGLTEQYMGPIFLSFGNMLEGEDIMTIGVAHCLQDGNTMDMRIVLNKKGTDTEEQKIIKSDVIHIDDSFMGKYVLCALRFQPSRENTDKVHFELAVALDNKVKTTYLEVEKAWLGDLYGSILIGRDVPFNATAYPSKAGPFNGPITEIRYDTEWINDLELYILSLGKKPYIYKLDTTSQITTREKTATEILDEAGVNLIQNPVGKYAFTNWSTTDTEGNSFAVQHADPTLGNCFTFVKAYPTLSKNFVLYSTPITLPSTDSSLYSLRAIMTAQGYSSGIVGVGIRWLQEGEAFDPTAVPSATSPDLFLQVDNSGVPKYYKGASYSGAAKYAVAYMMIAAGSSLTNIKFSKLKFEKGEATYFTEDSGANYALYY